MNSQVRYGGPNIGDNNNLVTTSSSTTFITILVTACAAVAVVSLIAFVYDFQYRRRIPIYSSEFVNIATVITKQLFHLSQTKSPTPETLQEYRNLLQGTQLFVTLHVLSAIAGVDFAKGELDLEKRVYSAVSALQPPPLSTSQNEQQNPKSVKSKSTLAVQPAMPAVQPAAATTTTTSNTRKVTFESP